MYIIRKKSSVIVLTGTLLIISISLFSCKNRRSESTSVENESKEFNIDNVRKEIDVANLEFVNLFNKSANIQTHYSLVMNAGANKLGLTTIGLWGDEKMLAEEGEYTFIDKDDKPLDKGKYIVLWKMEDGKWKLFRDCYNSDLPMQH
jgi:hypothetical protein